MRFTDYLLFEGELKKLKDIADDIIDEFADEQYFNHDMVIKVARGILMKDPEYADPRRMKAALEIISQYISPAIK